MDTSSPSSASQVSRPGFITAYVLLLWMGGALLLLYTGSLIRPDFLSAVKSLAEAGGSTVWLSTAASIGTLLAPALLGLFVFIIGVDLWRMKYRAWLLMVFLHVLSLVLMLLGLSVNLDLLGPAGRLYSLVMNGVGVPAIGLAVSGVINGAVLAWLIFNRRLFDGTAGAVVYIVMMGIGVVVVFIVLAVIGSATGRVYSDVLHAI